MRSVYLSYQLGPGQGDLDSIVLQMSRHVSHPSTRSHPKYVHRTHLNKGNKCNDYSGLLPTHIVCVFSCIWCKYMSEQYLFSSALKAIITPHLLLQKPFQVSCNYTTAGNTAINLNKNNNSVLIPVHCLTTLLRL